MRRRRTLTMLGAAALAAGLVAGLAAAGAPKTDHKNFQYSIGLWGDMPYSDAQAKTGVPNLIADMNNSDIQFSIHDGDLKAGSGTPGSVTPTTCADALYTQALGYFNSLNKPAFFTTGDNDWTDCDRSSNGSYNATERLQHERQVFFSTDRSLGRHTMKTEVQTSGPHLCDGWNYSTNSEVPNQPCPENRLWTFHKVTYVTLNVQGTCNNDCGSGQGDTTGNPAEFQARNAADIDWLDKAFEEATAKKSAGLMIVWQADPGFDTSSSQGEPRRVPTTLVETDGQPDGFHDLLVELRQRTISFGKPVVLVHGDSHYFRIDKPLLDANGKRVSNFTRVETFGDNQGSGTQDNNWVKVLVDPNSRDVFAFEPQVVPANQTANTP